MSGLLVPDEVSRRIGRQQDRAIRAQVAKDNQQFRYCQTLAATGENLIETIDNPEHRLMFGLPPLDCAMRGVGRREVCFVTGKAHSGKTQLTLNLVRANAHRRLIMFTPDEVDSLVLAKLVAMTQGMNLEDLEEDIRSGSSKAKEVIRRTCGEVFPNLFVVDQTLTLDEMGEALDEAQAYWGEPCEGMILDYLDLLPGEADYTSTKGKSTGIKRWVKRHDVPGVIIHQPKRSGARRGQEIGMDDLHMAGDTEATFVLGVFRKQDDADLDDVERMRHAQTVTVHISKNKHPPCKRGTWDFHMSPTSGLIRELTRWDEIGPGAILRHWSEAAEARALVREGVQSVDGGGTIPDRGDWTPPDVGMSDHDPQAGTDDPLQ